MKPFTHQDLMVAVVPEDGESFEAWDCAASECPPSKPCTNDTTPHKGLERPAFEAGMYEALQAELDRKIR